MWLRLKRKTDLLLIALVVVTLSSSAAMLYFTWNTRHNFNKLVDEHMVKMVAIAELDVTLLKQRGFVSAYIIDKGNQDWLKQQNAIEPVFRRRLGDLEHMANTSEEQALLRRIRDGFEGYDQSRAVVVELFNGGDLEGARREFVNRVMTAYKEVEGACDDLVVYNQRAIESVLRMNNRDMDLINTLVALGALLIVMLSVSMVWMLYRDVYGPLRDMNAEMQAAAVGPDTPPPPPPETDLAAVGMYLRHLISEVSTSREAVARSRQEADQARRLAIIGNAVAHLAHEIKNALTSIGGFARLIAKRPHDSVRVQEGVRIIMQCSNSLEHMIREVLDFSRPGGDSLVPQSVNAVVREVLASLRACVPLGVVLETDLDPAIPMLSLPVGALDRVIANLVGNALDAQAEKGGWVHVRTACCEKEAMVIISDNGPGIPREIQDRIFEPFFTTKPKGNGLGLAICQQTISDIAGSIQVDSEPGRGATFTVRLPIDPK